MPLVRMTHPVVCADLPGCPGEEVELSPKRAAQVVNAGWGVIVRDRTPETPEARAEKPETAASVRRAPRRRKTAEA